MGSGYLKEKRMGKGTQSVVPKSQGLGARQIEDQILGPSFTDGGPLKSPLTSLSFSCHIWKTAQPPPRGAAVRTSNNA